MFIVWQGWGLLSIVIPVAFAVAGAALGLGDTGIAIGVFIGAIVNAWLGYKLNTKPGKILVDPATEEQVELRRKHTVFWIPMQYLSVLWLLFSVLLFCK